MDTKLLEVEKEVYTFFTKDLKTKTNKNKEGNGVCVMGNSSKDEFFFVDHFPKEHETLHCKRYLTALGGKADNQFIQLCRLSSSSSNDSNDSKNFKPIFIGCVGDDTTGDFIINNFKKHGGYNVDKHVRRIKNCASGLANIMVEEKTGLNRIIIVSAANEKLTNKMIDESWEDVKKNCKYVVCQLEAPMETALHIFEKVKNEKDKKMKTILNPAPSKPLPEKMYPLIDIFIPNEEEVFLYSGIKVQNVDDAKKACLVLSKKGIKTTIITLGSKGCVIYDSNKKDSQPKHIQIERKPTKIVDTTGAGDSFVGSLVFFLSNGVDIEKSCRFANLMASHMIQFVGAQSSIGRDQLLKIIESKMKNEN